MKIEEEKTNRRLKYTQPEKKSYLFKFLFFEVCRVYFVAAAVAVFLGCFGIFSVLVNNVRVTDCIFNDSIRLHC